MIHKVNKPDPDPSQVSASPPEEPAADDPRYFKLTKPFAVGDKTFDRLLIDSSELSGTIYFNLVGRFRKEYPDIYRTSFNKLGEEIFLSYVVAELNPPMVVEDVRKLSFKDLPIMFLQLASFIFGVRTETATKE